MDDGTSNPSIDVVLAGVKELEKDLALADYELRTSLLNYSQGNRLKN